MKCVLITLGDSIDDADNRVSGDVCRSDDKLEVNDSCRLASALEFVGMVVPLIPDAELDPGLPRVAVVEPARDRDGDNEGNEGNDSDPD